MGKATDNSIKILVTGANGQLGKCFQDIAINYPTYEFHFKSSVELDITSAEGTWDIFAQLKFDYCINCAAYTDVDKAESDKENAFMINAEAVQYLAKACKAQNTILIHISTDFVFDGTNTIPYKTSTSPNPINVYGASKLRGEQYIHDILNQYFIVRTSWLYSEYGHNFVKTMLRLASERDEINVVNDQIGSPTYAKDLAESILKIIVNNLKDFGVYHYSNEGNISWYDFAIAIFELSNISINVNPISSLTYATSTKRPEYSVLNNSKIKNNFGINPPKWRDSLEVCLINLT